MVVLLACLPVQDCQVSDDLNPCEQYLLWKELPLLVRHCSSLLLWFVVCNVGMQLQYSWPDRKPINPSLFCSYFLVYLFTRIIWKMYEIFSNAFHFLEWAYYFELFGMSHWVLGWRLLNLPTLQTLQSKFMSTIHIWLHTKWIDYFCW